MALFYGLELRHYVYGPDCESYDIGIFRTREDAEQTAQRYLQEVPGFCDFECDYLIHEIELKCSDDITHIHTFEGWNTDDEGGTTDIIECKFSEKVQAEAAMEAAKAAHPRQSWALDCWEIGVCEWAAGFESVYSDGSIAPALSDHCGMLESLAESHEACDVSFIYGGESIPGQPLAVGGKLFLIQYEPTDTPHSYTIRQLRDIYKIDTRRRSMAETEGESLDKTERPYEKLLSLVEDDTINDLNLDEETDRLLNHAEPILDGPAESPLLKDVGGHRHTSPRNRSDRLAFRL